MKNLDSLLFRIDMAPRQPQPGSLLVAEPFLHDNYFNHAVIELVDYTPQGKAMGVVLNNPTAYTLQEVISGVETENPIPICCGGPMSSDRLYFIHTLGDLIPKSRYVAAGLWIGGDFDAMLSYVNSGYPVEGIVRFCLGYSGWDEGQLDEELRAHVWAVADPVDNETMLTLRGDRLWHHLVRSMGPSFRNWRYYPKNTLSN